MDDKVELPDYPYTGSTFSGYFDIHGKMLHYILHESQRSPLKDPLVLWLNGGPGCSRLLGWGQEHGPASIEEKETTFKLNPFSWNKQANMIYLESPVATGLFYTNNPILEITNDIISGKYNLEAVIKFFNKFQQFKSNDFYNSGESYAGIYVPILATMILDFNNSALPGHSIRLKGITIRNPVTDWNVDSKNAFYYFAFHHSLYSNEIRHEYEMFCLTLI